MPDPGAGVLDRARPGTPVSPDELALMRRIDELHLEHPFGWARMLSTMLKRARQPVGRRQVSTMMKRMGIHALYRKPTISTRHPAHPVYPYLLRYLTITRSNHVWTADITYLPMQRGFVYLFAAIDWASRRVLSWSLSNTLTTRLLSERRAGSHQPLRRAGHLQHGPRLPVHEPGIHGHAEGPRDPDQHGWKRLLAGQRVRGAALEERQIRGGVPARLRVRQRCQERMRHIRCVLQPEKTAHGTADNTPDEVYFENLPALSQTA